MNLTKKLMRIGIITAGILVAVFIYTSFPKNSEESGNPFNNLLRKKLIETKEKDPISMKIPIFMYHYVEYNQNEEDFLRDQQNVPPNIFEGQLITLKNEGYTFITPKDIPNALKEYEKNQNNGKKYIILTFDDGFRDFYTDAYPILKKHKIPTINYIVYNYINGQDYMTHEMVKTIADDPLIEIGSHTLNHAYLLDIPEENAWVEISRSKELLEQAYSVKITSFAYPYGNYDERAVRLVEKAGYENAVTVEIGGTIHENQPFTLKRIRPGHLGGSYLIQYLNDL